MAGSAVNKAILSRTPSEIIGSFAAFDRVLAIATFNCVVTFAADDFVLAEACCNVIVTIAAFDVVIQRRRTDNNLRCCIASKIPDILLDLQAKTLAREKVFAVANFKTKTSGTDKTYCRLET